MKRFFIFFLAGLIIVLGIWHIAIPDTMILRLFNAALEEQGLSAEMTGTKKGFFFSFVSDRLNIQKNGVTLVSIENVRGKIDPLSPFSFRLSFFLSGHVGGGSMNTRFDLLRSKKFLSVTINNAEIEDIPLLSTVGLEGKGLLSGDLKVENDFGELKFNINNADIKSISFGGMPVPLEMFSEAKGFLSLNSDATEIKSLTLEGEGIFARAKGSIAGSAVRLDIELMPERSFKEKNPIFSLLEQYRKSPGYYFIPINNNI